MNAIFGLLLRGAVLLVLLSPAVHAQDKAAQAQGRGVADRPR